MSDRHTDLTNNLARDLVSDVLGIAPEALYMFDDEAELKRFLQPFAKERDNPLEFGGGVVLDPTLVAVALTVAAKTIEFALEKLLEAVGEETKDALRSKLQQSLRRNQEPAGQGPLNLSQAEIDRIRADAEVQARAHGLDEAVSRTLATALIGRLVTTAEPARMPAPQPAPPAQSNQPDALLRDLLGLD
jgi:hypothetical protein